MRVLLQGEYSGALAVYKRVLESINADMEVLVQDDHYCITDFDAVLDFGRTNPCVLKGNLQHRLAG